MKMAKHVTLLHTNAKHKTAQNHKTVTDTETFTSSDEESRHRIQNLHTVITVQCTLQSTMHEVPAFSVQKFCRM